MFNSILLVRNPDYGAIIFKASNVRSRFLTQALAGQGVGANLLTLNGEKWRIHREIISPAFQASTLKKVFWIFDECVDVLMKKWEDGVDKEGIYKNGNMGEDMKLLTLEIIGLAAYGERFGGINSNNTTQTLKCFECLLEDLNKRINRKVTLMKSSKVKEAVNYLRKQILSILNRKLTDITERKNIREKPDLLDNLLIQRSENKEGDMVTDYDIVSESMLFLIAGSETTSNTLAFMMQLLALFPNVQEKLYKDIMQEFGDREIDFDGLSKCKYLEWTINEAMRLYPTVERTSRLLGESIKLGNHVVPKDTVIIVDMKSWQLNPKYWDNPQDFYPERFENFDKKNKTLSPFGGGKRICVGRSLAFTELQVTTIKILRKFKLSTKEGKYPIPTISNFTVQPVPFEIEIKSRN